MIKSCTYGARGLMDFMGIPDSPTYEILMSYGRRQRKSYQWKRTIAEKKTQDFTTFSVRRIRFQIPSGRLYYSILKYQVANPHFSCIMNPDFFPLRNQTG
jgi:hypothetical protein